MDEYSIENSLEVQNLLVKCLFWGGCHHLNVDKNSKIEPGQKNGSTIKNNECELVNYSPYSVSDV